MGVEGGGLGFEQTTEQNRPDQKSKSNQSRLGFANGSYLRKQSPGLRTGWRRRGRDVATGAAMASARARGGGVGVGVTGGGVDGDA